MSHSIIAIALACAFMCVESGAEATPLKGRVTHHEHLSPLQNGQRAGDRFDSKAMTSFNPHNNWFRVPHWLAGTWSIAGEATRIYKRDCLTGKVTHPNNTFRYSAGSADRIGHQKDKEGNIWHQINLPFEDTIYYFDRSETEHRITQSLEPTTLSRDKLCLKFLNACIVVDTVTRAVKDSYQEEEILIYERKADRLLLTSSRKKFDHDGGPVLEEKVLEQRTRISEYANGGSSQAEDFRAFLIGQGLSQLVAEPTDH